MTVKQVVRIWEQMYIQVWNLEKIIDADPIAGGIFAGQRRGIIMDHLHTMKLQL
ncbi:MAG: hypothetical protein WBP64_19345 [Nitrososphaeraceae archaeon]